MSCSESDGSVWSWKQENSPAAVFKTWPLELRKKSPYVPEYTQDIVYFGSSERRFFSQN